MGKLFIAYRVGRNHIKWPAQLVIQQPENAVDHIIRYESRQDTADRNQSARQAKDETVAAFYREYRRPVPVPQPFAAGTLAFCHFAPGRQSLPSRRRVYE